MNNNIRKLAKQAGFCFWEDEAHKPEGAVIDWSSEYDEDFVRYTMLLAKEVIELERAGCDVYTHFGFDEVEPQKYETIEISFSDEDLFRLMKAAHEHDLTLNKFISKLLRDHMIGMSA